MLNQDLSRKQKSTKSRGKRGHRKRQGKRAGARKSRLKYVRLAFNYIRIIHWNCASVRQRGAILERLVYCADIVALQETRLNNSELRMAGFNCFYNRRHLGTAILVRDNIAASEVDMSKWDSEEIQLQAIRVESERPFLLVNVYACNGKVNSQKWRCLGEIASQEKNVIFIGDYNAKSLTWCNQTSNKQGEELEDALDTTDLVCMNNGCFTRMATRAGDQDSVIDLALVSPSLTSVSRWYALGYHGSDHRPCCLLIKKGCTSKTQRLRSQSFRYNSTEEDVVGKLRRDKRLTHNKRLNRYEQPPWWNDEVEKAWLEKRRAVQNWQDAKKCRMVQPVQITNLKRLMDAHMNDFKALAKKVKREKWEEFCVKVGNDKSLQLFWGLHRSMNGAVKKNHVTNFQSTDHTWQTTDETKGQALLAHYLSQSDQKDMSGRWTARNSISERCTFQKLSEEDSVTVDEIKATLKRSKNSSPGPDGIRYEDIGRLTDEELEELAGIYNRSIETGFIKEEWMHAYLKPMPKPYKDHTKIQGYRIITLQNTIGKLLEKIIARKISNHLERLDILPSTLGGYRPGRETWTNAAVFAYDVYEGFHSHDETCAAVIDLEDAYNRVPFDFLMSQLSDCKISLSLLNWISTALFQRKVVFKCGMWTSEPTIIHPGLPQGSPLSPVLFNVYTLRITAEQTVGLGRTMSYADDVLVYRHGRNRQNVAQELQTELNRILSWCNEAGAVVNPTKAQVTWFSLSNHIYKAELPEVNLSSEIVEKTFSMKYLGVQFDRCLAFNDHVDNVVIKARKGLAAMRVMAGADCQQRHLVLLYQGLVLSVIEYALAILTVSQTQIEKLERIQNEAMRIILGCTKDTSCRAMRYLLDFPTIADRINLCRARAYLRVSADLKNPLHSAVKEKKGNRLLRGKSWMGQSEDIIQQVCLLEDIEPGEEWVRVPSDCLTSFSVCITLDRECRQQNPVSVEAEVQALISENSSDDNAIIYTDGSVVRHVRSSWAYTTQVKGITVKEDSGAFALTTSSLTMEVMAVTKAMIWLESQSFTGACFLSDSMSMLRKIENGWIRRQWLESLRRSRLTTVCFIFVPGHAGVRGNERADKLASTASVKGGRAMDRADILNALAGLGHANDLDDTDESATMTRLLDLQVKRGEARGERYVGSERRIVNQHRTGVVSHYTLCDILKMRSERLWTWFDAQ